MITDALPNPQEYVYIYIYMITDALANQLTSKQMITVALPGLANQRILTSKKKTKKKKQKNDN